MARCADWRMPAVALTDQSNLFGLVKFYRKAFAAGVKPLIGVDLRIANEDEIDRPHGMVLLCKDLGGYRNLTQLVTRSFLEGQHRGIPMVEADWLNHDSMQGLIAM
ncbi:MAG: DNA polymerase-3 subunit alpha, partial [Woeseiaceae bacterium]